jgi:sulfate adenylyltransferase
LTVTELALTRDQFLDFQKIGIGAFAPLSGFMIEDDFRGVVARMRLSSGALFSIPIYLDVSADVAAALRGRPRVPLTFQGVEVGTLDPQSLFTWDRAAVAETVFGTGDAAHPGVAKMLSDREWCVGGPVSINAAGRRFLFADELSPDETKAAFAARGWKTIAGFQTRNVPHRAHEYLQRVALELCDGLFVQPLLGRKKAGDYTPEAIMTGYRSLVGSFLPHESVVLGVLSTAMRYAGPREAVFHAIIRRNYGCTHFVIGRDHAGVGSYYGKYDAHALARSLAPELGINILTLHGPFYCARCGTIATEQTCAHTADGSAVTEISGTLMRRILGGAERPDPQLMRPEVVAAIAGVRMFVEEDEL